MNKYSLLMGFFALFLTTNLEATEEKKGIFTKYDDKLEWCIQGEIARLEPYGNDALRFRSSKNLRISEQNWNLLPQDKSSDFSIEFVNNKAVVRNGNICAEVEPSGRVHYYDAKGKLLIQEGHHKHDNRYTRKYLNRGGDFYELHVTFDADKDEKLYGMGQYPNDCLNLKGTVLELAQKNTQISIPYLVSNKGYGFLWNNPSVGRAELSLTHTRFTASMAEQIDYVIISKGTIAELVRAYVDFTGHSPEMPYFATGFWQSKLRYASQEELLGIAKEYKKRNLPISVIVADYYHWPNSGDWKFNEKFWPNPQKMVEELHDMNIELLVSVWPTVGRKSENYREMSSNNYLINVEQGSNILLEFVDNLSYVDVTNPKARSFFWDKCKKNYFDKGVRMFWLDEAEPEIEPLCYENLRYYLGNGLSVSNIYPYYFAKTFYEGQIQAGQKEIINLVRSGWIGSQRFGTLLWSGDIDGNFSSLRKQIKAGLNISLCGIPWWNTDIGGFFAKPAEKGYNEMLIRWFQYATFCPVMRLHGSNFPSQKLEGQLMGTGAPNEVWSFGEDVYEILSRYLFIREKLRPYIYENMKLASKNGDPVMRPMFYDFPDDKNTYDYEYQYMFGPDILVVPIVDSGVTSCKVYLPNGSTWKNAKTGKVYKGGKQIEIKVDLNDIPVFFKDEFYVNLYN